MFISKRTFLNILKKAVADYLPEMPAMDKMIKEELENAWEDVANDYELDSSTQAEQIEYKRRDGFIPDTQGGYEIKDFTDVGSLMGRGISPVNEKASKEIEKLYDAGMEIALDEFWDQNKDQLEKEGFTKKTTNYHSLNEKGLEDLAEKLSEMEYENNDSENGGVMFQMGVYYYEPTDEDDDHSIYVYAEVNTETPYFRSKYGTTTYQEDIDFKTAGDLRPKLRNALSKAADSLRHSSSPETKEPEREKAPVQRISDRKMF
jgi:hypothetical protein